MSEANTYILSLFGAGILVNEISAYYNHKYLPAFIFGFIILVNEFNMHMKNKLFSAIVFLSVIMIFIYKYKIKKPKENFDAEIMNDLISLNDYKIKTEFEEIVKQHPEETNIILGIMSNQIQPTKENIEMAEKILDKFSNVHVKNIINHYKSKIKD
jgi:hypothetical protein